MKAVHRLADRPRFLRRMAAGALALGIGGAGAAVGLAGAGPARSARPAVTAAPAPYFVCVGLLSVTGFCVGPPTA
jgi:hypothetical protein